MKVRRTLTSKGGRVLLAGIAVVAALAFSSISHAPLVYSSTLVVQAADGLLTFVGGQDNVERCVDGIKSVQAINQGHEEDKRVTQVKVRFDSKNICDGALLSVGVIDKHGRVSTGTYDNLPLGIKDNVLVTTEGSSVREDKPKYYLLVS